MSFTLPKLPYSFDALEPHIDARTMEIHYGKHHQGYVNKLNGALEGHPELQNLTALELLLGLDSIPDSIRTAVRDNGGGHVNHSLFWPLMSPGGGGTPGPALGGAIDAAFGSLDELKARIKQAGMTQFGSGWAWLALDGDMLKVLKTPNAENPLVHGMSPILGLDVWEHAYYLDYQNQRDRYIDTFLGKLINWAFAARNYEADQAAA